MEGAAAVTAIVVSVASLIVAIQTADSNEKLVAASTWPFLQLDSSNTDSKGQLRISLSVSNSGVGPAKIETFEVFWEGKAYGDSQSLLAACCDYNAMVVAGESGASAVGPTVGTMSNVVVRAGETRTFFELPREGMDGAVWQRVDRARLSEIKYRACYCSVFDECWISDLTTLHPQEVKSCPVPKVPYRE